MTVTCFSLDDDPTVTMTVQMKRIGKVSSEVMNNFLDSLEKSPSDHISNCITLDLFYASLDGELRPYQTETDVTHHCYQGLEYLKQTEIVTLLTDIKLGGEMKTAIFALEN